MTNVVQVNACDSMNGPGLRVSVFVSGCRLGCRGCFNPEAQAFSAGSPLDAAEVSRIIAMTGADGIRGLSILGGDPLEPENIPGVAELLQQHHIAFGDTRDVWLWTGRTVSAAKRIEGVQELLRYVDVLVDGPFIEAQADAGLLYRGSRNQKLWQVCHTPLANVLMEI